MATRGLAKAGQNGDGDDERSFSVDTRPGRFSALALLTSLLTTAAAADPLSSTSASTLGREPLLTPDEIGDGSVDPLEFPDPTEGLALCHRRRHRTTVVPTCRIR